MERGPASHRPGRRLAGVASGLGDYFNVDPVIVRIAFVLLAIAGGLGILAYLVMWWIVPPTHELSNPGEKCLTACASLTPFDSCRYSCVVLVRAKGPC